MKEIGIFLHIGNVILWDEINDYIKKIKNDLININLFINFCKDYVSDIDINEYKTIIKNEYPKTKFFNFKNKGCDIGPYFLFLDYLRNKNITYDWIIKLHTKSNDKWRDKLLQGLFVNNFNEHLDNLEKNNINVHGSYSFPYDYFNIKFDIKNLELLNVNFIKNWKLYTEKFPETKNYTILEKINHAKKDIKNRVLYLPDIYLEFYDNLFGDYKKDHKVIDGRNKWFILQKLIIMKKNIIYYPGTYLLIKHKIINKIFKNVNYLEIYKSLEENKLDDNLIQSNTHSWERILPLSIILFKE